ncbi:MAG: ANTAR domain-containing protein [Eubacteriales bacterium]|nr:ANTAR domain-containing protein [Eubacteriales bacterium]
MPVEKTKHRVLIVSSSDKAYDYFLKILPQKDFHPILRANRAGEAKRILLSSPIDIMIINTPLSDEFGIDLALDSSDSCMGILVMVKSEVYDQTVYTLEDNGILTLSKPNSVEAIYSAVKLLAATNKRITRFEKKIQTLKDKMNDIRTVNRAKWLLIENMNMAEKDAHYYIEKQAMDTRLSRREIAENIIRTYDK